MKTKLLVLLVVALLIGVCNLGVSAGALQPTGEITSPDVGELVFGTGVFEAVYYDDDPQFVQWAVRYNTCAAATNTVFGNVDGHSDPYDWLDITGGKAFYAAADVSGWTPGAYCFVLNPKEESDETDVRLTRWFYVVDKYVSGGGQLIEAPDGTKRPEWHVISFGGAVGSAGSAGYVGEMQVNFHNVGVDGFDGSTFHTTSITNMTFFPQYTCGNTMNFTAMGVWNQTPGYKMIFRAEDAGEPGLADNARIEMWAPSNTKVYDTDWPTEFAAESTCNGTHRTGLDNGNLQIAW